MYSATSTLNVRNSVTQSSYLSVKLSGSEGSPVPQTNGLVGGWQHWLYLVLTLGLLVHLYSDRL